MSIKQILYFASQRAIGSRVAEYLSEFRSLERVAPGRLREIQEQRLESLLAHAVAQVPFYRQRVRQARPVLDDFPILRKADLRDSFLDLMTPELKREYSNRKHSPGYSWIAVKTGGSTGMPTTVIHDREYRDRGRAAKLYSQMLCGFPLGTPYLRLWGSMQEISRVRNSWKNRAQSYLSNEQWLNAFQMGEEQVRGHIAAINASRAQHMMAYVDAAAELARFARAEGITVKPLQSVMACAGTLTEDARRLLHEVFQARVHNQYGSRDCSSMACECERGGLHYYAHHVHMEIVDDNGERLPVNRPGRLLVTLLSNWRFPIIRYEIGDVGGLSSELCACGRSYPLMSGVEGRTVEFLRSSDGGYVSPVYIRHLLGVVHNPGFLRRFQLVQHSLTDFELRLELEPGVPDERRAEMKRVVDRDLKAVLGPQAQIRQLEITQIPASSSGKFLYTINCMQAKDENHLLSHSA